MKGWLYPANGMCSWLLGGLGPAEPRCQEWPRTKREKVKSDCRRSSFSRLVVFAARYLPGMEGEERMKEEGRPI